MFLSITCVVRLCTLSALLQDFPLFFFNLRNDRWALCPNGYYLEGVYRTASSNGMLHNIEEGKCCRPQSHPDSYEGCYDEDVGISFDSKGWSECKQAGYYMTGFYKGSCDKLYCIEKFRCCKMKKGNHDFQQLVVRLKNARNC